MTKAVKTPSKKKIVTPGFHGKLPGKLNEFAGFNISTHIKISDPNTGQVLVQKRGDS
jgi:hypothetical protein